MNEPWGFFLFNAASGKGKLTPTDILAELPTGTKLHEIAEGDDPVALARHAISEGASWIAVAGGDGTVEAVAGALVDTPVPLGVIACGTYNNFARSAGLPMDPLEAARLVRAGRTREMDVGFVNGKPFFECVGAGLDAALFPMGEEIKSGGFWKWIELFKIAARYPRQTFDITLDRPFKDALADSKGATHPIRRWRKSFRKISGHRLRLQALMVTVSNGPFYGANFAVAPDARIDDGLLTVTIFKKYHKLELCWHFFSISSGRRRYAPLAVTLNAREVQISGPKTLEVHKDGSALAEWPLDIRLAPKRLTIFSEA